MAIRHKQIKAGLFARFKPLPAPAKWITIGPNGAAYSESATTGWLKADFGNLPVDPGNVWRDCAYGNLRDGFVAVGNGLIGYSQNGKVWRGGNVPSGHGNLWSIAYSPTLDLYAIGSQDGYVFTGNPRIGWTQRYQNSGGGTAYVKWCGDRFMAVFNTGTSRCVQSTNGTTWTTVTPLNGVSCYSITRRDNGIFVVGSVANFRVSDTTDPTGTWSSVSASGFGASTDSISVGNTSIHVDANGTTSYRTMINQSLSARTFPSASFSGGKMAYSAEDATVLIKLSAAQSYGSSANGGTSFINRTIGSAVVASPQQFCASR